MVMKARHLPGHSHDCFLNDVLGIGFTQTAFDRDAVNQLPVSVEEGLPTFLILPILEPRDQAPPSGNECFAFTSHGGIVCHTQAAGNQNPPNFPPALDYTPRPALFAAGW